MRATWLPEVLRAAGLTVIETPGWRGRGRDLEAVAGLVMHHTASSVRSTLQTNLNVVTNGNGFAPGPIAQAMFWRDGVVYIIGDGRANHAGRGGPYGGWLPQDRANLRTLGFECVNNGVGEPWSAELVAAMEIGAAAVMRYLDLPAERTIMHSEWAPGRKIDPAGPNGGRIAYAPGPVNQRAMVWSGDAFRARVRDWLTPPPLPPIETIPPTEETDDDMASIIITNAEPHPVYGAAGTGRFLLLDDGRLRHITTISELAARGDLVRARWTNAELAAAGIS
jgi:hypothetical protein